jgi:non-lysosomal glucosylceramidase
MPRGLGSGIVLPERLLFNGSYYQQKVVAPCNFGNVATKWRYLGMGAAERANKPEFQIEDGCIIDQLLGDTFAQIAGLGPVLDREHAKPALTSIHRLKLCR